MNNENENKNTDANKNIAGVNDGDNTNSSINALLPLREQKILKLADTYSSKSQDRLLAEILAEIKVHNKRMRWFIGIGTLALVGIFIMLFCLLIS